MIKRTSRLVVVLALTVVAVSALSNISGFRALSAYISAEFIDAGTAVEPKPKTFLKKDDSAPTAPFAAGNLVIYRVGDGAAPLSSAATAVFLDEYTTIGSSVQSIAMPTAVNGAQKRLTSAGSSTSEGFVTRSADGQYLVLAGYDAALATASVAGTTSATVNRVIGRVDATGAIDSSTALTDAASGGNPRGATSTNGTDLWISGSAGGVRYATLGGTTSTQLSTTVTNLRATNIFGGQLYISTSSGSAVRVGAVGTGTPQTTGQTITNLPGFPTAGGPYAFHFADLDASVAGADTLYVADDAPGTIQKYSLVAGNWTANGTISIPTARGLTASVSGSNVTLFVTNGPSLQSFTDTSGYNATITGTPATIATAPTNTAFRGIAFAPAGAGGNPGTIQLTASTQSVGEGAAFATVTASRTGGSTGSVGVAYATSNGTATAGPPCNAPNSDYNAASGSFVWGPGETVDKSFTVPICDDADFEPDETFSVTITNPSGGATLGTTTQQVVTITNNDAQPTVIEFAAAVFVGGDESQSATVVVTRSGNVSGASSINYATGGGVALPSIRCSLGADYVAKSGTLNFAASDTSEQFTVELCPDAFTEGNESFNVTLSNPAGGSIGTNSTAQVQINDTASKYRNANAIVINDGAQSAASTIEVSGEAGPVGSLRVTLYDLNHNSVNDIDVLLVGPSGQNILLVGDAGGATGLFGTRTLTFVDSAGQVLPQSGGVDTGNFEPTTWTPGQPNFNSPAPVGPYNEPGSSVGGGPNLTSVFGGTNPNGAWSLYIRDDNGAAFSKRESNAGGTNGTLFGGWGLEIFTNPGATTSISGKVQTPGLFGVRGVVVEVTGGGLTSAKYASTSSFGYYTIGGLQAGQTYTIRFVNRRYLFAPSTATFTSNSNLSGADAIAFPQ